MRLITGTFYLVVIIASTALLTSFQPAHNGTINNPPEISDSEDVQGRYLSRTELGLLRMDYLSWEESESIRNECFSNEEAREFIKIVKSLGYYETIDKMALYMYEYPGNMEQALSIAYNWVLSVEDQMPANFYEYLHDRTAVLFDSVIDPQDQLQLMYEEYKDYPDFVDIEITYNDNGDAVAYSPRFKYNGVIISSEGIAITSDGVVRSSAD